MKRAIRKYRRDVIALIGMAIVATGIAGYILSQQRLQFPFISEKPQVLKVELQDAQAVTAGQGQTVRVAGVKVGDIGKVEVQDGTAVVEMRIDHKYKGLVRRDATALLRPKTALKDMFIELDPGRGKPMKENERIRVKNSAPDVDPDEILSALDSDTRDYLKILISSGGKGLRGHGEDLRQTLLRLEPLHRDLARVNMAVATRRRSLKTLVSDYGSLMTELSSKDEELTRLVGASNQVFSALAAERTNVSATVHKLPGTLRRTESALAKLDTLGARLGPALNALRPPFRRLATTNASVGPLAREATPIVRDQIRPFARTARPFIADLGAASTSTVKALPDLTRSFNELNRLFNLAAYNPGGAEGLTGNLERDRNREEGLLYWLAWVSHNGVSVFNTSDATGVLRRVTLCGVEAPAAVGLAQQVVNGIVASNPALNNVQVLTTAQKVLTSGFGTCSF